MINLAQILELLKPGSEVEIDPETGAPVAVYVTLDLLDDPEPAWLGEKHGTNCGR